MSQTERATRVLLIIDSSLFIIERLVSMLNEVKIIEKIFSASEYHEAIGILQKEKTDIVLLDIHLPGKNGIDLLNHIVINFPETQVIVLSNLVSEYYQKLCKKSGAFYFIDKSKDFDKIPEVILSLENL
jgi:DNA-binding NarL/FixJ family response regulator